MTYPADAASLLERVGEYYDFECEGGPLRMCRDFKAAQRQIALAVTAIDKALKEFDIAGKPPGYICRTDLQIARAALVGNPDYRTNEKPERWGRFVPIVGSGEP